MATDAPRELTRLPLDEHSNADAQSQLSMPTSNSTFEFVDGDCVESEAGARLAFASSCGFTPSAAASDSPATVPAPAATLNNHISCTAGSAGGSDELSLHLSSLASSPAPSPSPVAGPTAVQPVKTGQHAFATQAQHAALVGLQRSGLSRRAGRAGARPGKTVSATLGASASASVAASTGSAQMAVPGAGAGRTASTTAIAVQSAAPTRSLTLTLAAPAPLATARSGASSEDATQSPEPQPEPELTLQTLQPQPQQSLARRTMQPPDLSNARSGASPAASVLPATASSCALSFTLVGTSDDDSAAGAGGAGACAGAGVAANNNGRSVRLVSQASFASRGSGEASLAPSRPGSAATTKTATAGAAASSALPLRASLPYRGADARHACKTAATVAGATAAATATTTTTANAVRTPALSPAPSLAGAEAWDWLDSDRSGATPTAARARSHTGDLGPRGDGADEIGRASCRERV